MAGIGNLENQIKRRLINFAFSGSVKLGRFFANTFQCCCRPNEHKVARFTAGFTSGVVPKRIRGVEFQTTFVAGIPCRIYRPSASDGLNLQTFDPAARKKAQAALKLPVVVYIHGGGWTICSARSYHLFTASLCRDLGAIVVSVDYQLAPEYPYPAGYEDCLAVVRCLLNADSIDPSPFISGRVDTSRVVVAGDSAGGNLSGCVALDLIRHSNDVSNDTRLRALAMICPVTQAVNIMLPSYAMYAPDFGLDWFLANYAGVHPTDEVLAAIRRGEHLLPEGWALRKKYVELPTRNDDSTASDTSTSLSGGPHTRSAVIPQRLAELASNVSAWPLLADDAHLAKLPLTFVQACRYDPLFDENEMFANRVRQAGGDVRFVVVENAQHVEGVFTNLLKTKASFEAYNQIITFLEQVIR